MSGLSVLAKLRALLAREAPEQAQVIREALRKTAQTGREHSVVGLADEGGQSAINRGTESTVKPNQFDVRRAKQASGQPAVVDFHTHPDAIPFIVRPSQPDLEFYSSEWGPVRGRDIRTLIATPPGSDGGFKSGSAYNFFATEDPAKVLDPALFDKVRNELQFAARPKGSLRSLLDEPMISQYIEDSGENIGTLLEDASPLFLMRHQANKGLGRHELELGGYRLTPDPEITDREVFRRLENPILDFLKSKGFAQGGLAQYRECACGR